MSEIRKGIFKHLTLGYLVGEHRGVGYRRARVKTRIKELSLIKLKQHKNCALIKKNEKETKKIMLRYGSPQNFLANRNRKTTITTLIQLRLEREKKKQKVVLNLVKAG